FTGHVVKAGLDSPCGRVSHATPWRPNVTSASDHGPTASGRGATTLPRTATSTGRWARLVADAGPLTGGRGLDLGCGSGFATEGLLRAFPGVAWQGVDVSSPMLARAACKPTLAAVPLRH